MRTLVPFALALIGIGAFTADASAFGRRGSGCYGGGGCSGGGYGGCSGGGYGGCSGGGYRGGYAYGGYSSYGSVTYSAPVGYPTVTYSGNYGVPSYGTWSGVNIAPANGGKAAMIQTTDGAYYTLGSDGN